MQSPPSQNPFVLLAWIVGVPGGLAFLIAAVKFILLVGDAHKDLKTVVRYVSDRRTVDQAIETTLWLVESDIDALQEKTSLPTHPWPDRRTGPKDRRSA